MDSLGIRGALGDREGRRGEAGAGGCARAAGERRAGGGATAPGARAAREPTPARALPPARAAHRAGEPIGSGPVESACGQRQRRFKRPGQFWTQRGLRHLNAIIEARDLDHWDQLWAN